MSSWVQSINDAMLRLPLSRGGRRALAIALLLMAGWLDYLTGPELASAPFYIPILIGVALLEPWGVCLLYGVLAAGIFLAAELLSLPNQLTLIYPYWATFARLISFTLIPVTISHLVHDRQRLHESEQLLHARGLELERKNRELEETLRELHRLQQSLVKREREAAVGEAMYGATYEMERPLASIGMYVEELLRLASRAETHEGAILLIEEMRPLLDKLNERALDMEVVLRNTRRLRGENELLRLEPPLVAPAQGD